MRRRIRSVIAALKRKLFVYHQGPRPNIALFAIRRGGSTFLADGIWDEPGMFGVNEPFAGFPGHSIFADRIRKLLPEKPHHQLFELSPDELAQVWAYVQGLCSGLYRFGTCRRLRVPGFANRTMLKILNAPCLIDWFADTLQMDTVFLCRHPAPQALSVLRQGWGFSAEAYFDSDAFCNKYLTTKQIDLGRSILLGNDAWRKAILNWVIETLLPFRTKSANVLTLTYEELALCTRQTFEIVAHRLGLTTTERYAQFAAHPSGSSALSTEETKQRIKSGDTRYLLCNWRNSVSPEHYSSAQQILDAFQVTAYRIDRVLPNVDLRLHIEGLAAFERDIDL